MLDQAADLPQILMTWAELLDEDQPDQTSSVSTHARAAAARLLLLERAAIIATCYLELRDCGTDPASVAHVESALRAALSCLNAPTSCGDSRAEQFVDTAMRTALKALRVC